MPLCPAACSWERRLEAAYGTAAGLEFMHHSGIVHRDLTSYNVLLDFGRLPGTWYDRKRGEGGEGRQGGRTWGVLRGRGDAGDETRSHCIATA